MVLGYSGNNERDATVAKQTITQSLIPFLSPGKEQIYLKILLRSDELSNLENPHTPFLIVSDSDPLTCLISAKFTTHAGSDLKNVSLLVQRDKYVFPQNSLYPLNNKEIEKLWQQAFDFYLSRDHDSSFILLSRRHINRKGKLLSLRSLFFCKLKGGFFHPPCPNCGGLMELCDDDEILEAKKLQLYSSSLRRYLFCPVCHASTKLSHFYVYEREEFDSPILQDRWDLIKGFGKLTEGKSQSNAFPCVRCPNNPECYGSGSQATSRIFPFSFYPFYMFIFEAMSLHSLDFLSLISGASFDEVRDHLSSSQELGRKERLNILRKKAQAKSPFFFQQDDRDFLEILYLKLSFLSQITNVAFATPNPQKHPSFGLSIDRFWVGIEPYDSHLPFFWNFRVKPIDIWLTSQENSCFLKVPYSQSIYSLALIWFYSFLVNKNHSIEKVYRYLGEELNEHILSDTCKFQDFLKEPIPKPFLPENIFWNPERKSVKKEWHSTWWETLNLGLYLLSTSFRSDSKWSQNNFVSRINSLADEIKRILFQGISAGQTNTRLSENRALHEIILKIMKKWCIDSVAEQEVLEETLVDSTTECGKSGETIMNYQDEELIEETVILSPDDLEREVQPPFQKKQDVIPETIIVSPSDKPMGPSSSSQHLPRRDTSFQRGEVVVKQEYGNTSEVKKTIVECEEDKFLTETVILNLDETKNKE